MGLHHSICRGSGSSAGRPIVAASGPGSHLLLGRRAADSRRRHPSGGDRSGAGRAPRSELITELVERTTDPPPEEVDELCELMQLLVPSEFRDVLHSGPLVFEVDRSTAPVHWEFLSVPPTDGGGHEPLSVQLPFARQLRTVTAPRRCHDRSPAGRSGHSSSAIPATPRSGEPRGCARRGAARARDLSERDGVEVDARIGAPNVPREGPLRGIKPANRLDILSLLLRGEFDLVHYAGHGNFDEAEPDRVGWVFAGGLLTPHELERLERVPAIIVANACLTARTSQAIAAAKQSAAEDRGPRPAPAQPGRRILPARRPELRRHCLGGQRCRRDVVRRGVLSRHPPRLERVSRRHLVRERGARGEASVVAAASSLRPALGRLPALRRSVERRWPHPRGRCRRLSRFPTPPCCSASIPYLQYDSLESFRSDSARRSCP